MVQGAVRLTASGLGAVCDTFACWQLAVEAHGVHAFNQERTLVDQLEERVIEEHRRNRR